MKQMVIKPEEPNTTVNKKYLNFKSKPSEEESDDNSHGDSRASTSLKADYFEKSILNSNYVPIILPNGRSSYGGNQGWFDKTKRFSIDYILHNYGCGTIAACDLFLYWAIQNSSYNNEETKLALKNGMINQDDYINYVYRIHLAYTRTPRWLGVLGPKLAHAINVYNKSYNIKYRASWKWKLSYDEMLDNIINMLENDIPVIFSVGPNTPNLWGKKEVNLYAKSEENDKVSNDSSKDENKYIKVKSVNGHYMTITGITIDGTTGRIILCVSSWGKKYYIDYDEYRDYINKYGGTYTSSMVYINRM